MEHQKDESPSEVSRLKPPNRETWWQSRSNETEIINDKQTLQRTTLHKIMLGTQYEFKQQLIIIMRDLTKLRQGQEDN